MRTACLGCTSRRHHELTVQTSTPTVPTARCPTHCRTHSTSTSITSASRLRFRAFTRSATDTLVGAITRADPVVHVKYRTTGLRQRLPRLAQDTASAEPRHNTQATACDTRSHHVGIVAAARCESECSDAILACTNSACFSAQLHESSAAAYRGTLDHSLRR